VERNPSPDRNREGQVDKSEQDKSPKKITLEQHMKMFGTRNDQQAHTNEAPTSGLDGQGVRQNSMSDMSASEKKLVELDTRGHTEEMSTVAWSPDDRRMTSASKDHTVQVWDANSDTLLHTETGHTSEVEIVTGSSDGRSVAVTSSPVKGGASSLSTGWEEIIHNAEPQRKEEQIDKPIDSKRRKKAIRKFYEYHLNQAGRCRGA
jgi:WD40 repeat protein